MPKNLTFISIIALLLITATKNQKTYAYHTLALTWPPEFCKLKNNGTSPCKNGWDGELWDGNSFTIHGLWPQYNHKYDGEDKACAGKDSRFQLQVYNFL